NELANYHADQPAADAQPKSGDDEWQRRRDEHLRKDLHATGRERTRRLDVDLVRRADPGGGVDDDRKYRQQEDDRHLRSGVDAEDENEQRRQRDRRRSVDR